MLTKIVIEDFKRFDKVEIELGNPVVFIGPNNSGKTTALQALALWETGLKRWNEKRKGKKSSAKLRGATINRQDLLSVPIPSAKLLWRDIHVRNTFWEDGGEKRKVENIRINITLHGVTDDNEWACGMEFDYANEESLYCRPLRLSQGKNPQRMPVPEDAATVQTAFLPPMSGLAARETRLDPGAVNVRIGEGRTAEVLRNLCYRVYEEKQEKWEKLNNHINTLFGCLLDPPRYVPERGEVTLDYVENKSQLDISSSGRGLQQILLLLSYMYANPGTTVLLDEPDAHLEILRQRQIYQVLMGVALENGNQLIIASHSEVLLNEAADRDLVVAFVGSKPHTLNDRGSQVRKALRDIGWEHYYQAEETGWVLYLEGSTDLSILRSFARNLDFKKAMEVLDKPYVHYVGNNTKKAQEHFHGLKEAVPALTGIAIFDRLDREAAHDPELEVLSWKKREIENYFCFPEVLKSWAGWIPQSETQGPIFDEHAARKRREVMRQAIDEVSKALGALEKGTPWDGEMKVSEEFLTPLFRNYYKELDSYNLMAKKDFYELARFVPDKMIDPEVTEKLSRIVEVATKACKDGRGL